MKETLKYLFEGNRLTSGQACEILTRVGQGEFSDIEISSFLTVFLMRPIQAEELKGFRNALLNLSVKINLDEFETIDIVGTGGDEKNTFNISTLSAFVVAGAGYKVAKHGNYGVSSSCGSSNILENFGYKFSNNESKIKRELDSAGITFLHAPVFHPAMRFVAPVRKTLKLKTFFNKLGPMVNPSFPKNQLLGVYDMNVFDLYRKVYGESGINYTIVHSVDGYDEVSLTGQIEIASNSGHYRLMPRDFGFDQVPHDAISAGNTVAESAGIFMGILENNETVSRKNVVLANSGLAIQTFRPEKQLNECIEIARQSLESGYALKAFKKLMQNQ